MTQITQQVHPEMRRCVFGFVCAGNEGDSKEIATDVDELFIPVVIDGGLHMGGMDFNGRSETAFTFPIHNRAKEDNATSVSVSSDGIKYLQALSDVNVGIDVLM